MSWNWADIPPHEAAVLDYEMWIATQKCPFCRDFGHLECECPKKAAIRMVLAQQAEFATEQKKSRFFWIGMALLFLAGVGAGMWIRSFL